MRRVWEYEVMPAAVVVGLLDARQRVESGEGYVSDDADSRQLASLLSRGFQWIRTEDEMAVFERSVQK